MKQLTRALYFLTLLLTGSFASAQPFIVKIPDQTIQEDSATDLLPIRFSIPNLNLPRLTAQKSSSDTNVVPLSGIVFGGTGTNRTVRVSPKQNANGTATLTITLTDGQQTASTNFKVTVTPINDVPFISNIGDTRTPVNTPTLPIGFLVADPDNPVASLTLSGASDNQAVVANSGITFGGPGNGTNRTVKIAPVQNASGSANITVVVSDGLETASQTFKITVGSTTGDGVPVITQQPKGTNVVAGNPVVLKVVATGPELRYQWRFNGQDIPNQIGDTLTIPNTTAAQSGDFTVRVFNEFGQAISDKATVAITTAGATFDFGDAPSPYPTTAASNGAAQFAQVGFGLGTAPDAEADGQPDANAAGDDNNGKDDENGVVTPLQLDIGQTNRVVIFFTDSVHATPQGQLTVWFDFNKNGSWNDAGERFGPFALQKTGSNNIPIIVPVGVVAGSSFARFRLTADNPSLVPTGLNQEPGEVEDYPVTFQEGQTQPGINLDFGDAPDSYKTRLASDGPRHTLLQGFNLGKIIDLEPDAVLPLNGRGDDATPVAADDEDGVFLPTSLAPGQTATIQVLATIANGTGKLDAWFDWSRNGSFADAGEKMINSQTVTNGTNRFTFIVPSTATNGPSFARFRLTRQGVNSWFGTAPDGEVEDYLIQIAGEQQEQLDFGDAPQSANGGYPTTLARNGARHHLLEGLRLGKQIDLESDGQPNLTATGDDTHNSQDEDGIFFPAALVPGTTNVVQVTVSTPPGTTAFLDAWIDFTGDLDWSDAGEKIFSTKPVINGTQTLSFFVPANARSGVTFARFRLSQQGGLDFTGDGGNGEVEDLRVTVATAEDQKCDLSCMGTDFWVAFPGNYAPQASNPVKPVLHVVGPSNTVVTIENLAVNNTTKWTNTTGSLHIELNGAADLGELNDSIASKAVHITATAPITLWGLSKVNFTSDGFAGLPSEALGNDYIVATYGNVHTGVPELNGTQFAIVATETNTSVTIIPSTQTGIHASGVPYSITLTNRGDVYQLRNLDDAPADLTGTAILADKHIVVFSSHRIANIQSSDAFFADYLNEVLLPVTRWGKEFYTQPLATRTGGDTFRMVASADDTSLTINGAVVATLNRGQFFETLLDEASAVSADKPIEVMQFANSSDFDGVVNSDPFMVTVPARSHWSPSQTFTTPLNGFASHYINVVLSKSAAASLKLDGSGAGFTSFSEIDSLYTATSASVTPGTHSITCNEPVGLIVYGWNQYESYAWPACLFLGDTTPPVVTCTATNLVVVAGRDSDNEPCKARLGDYRDRIRGTDNCGLPEQGSVRQSPAPGTFLGVGTHTITLSVRDNAGNIGSCTFDFTVTDPNPNGDLTFTCPQDFAVRCTSTNGAIVNYDVVAFRGCTPLTTNLTCTPPPGSIFPPGTNRVTCVLRVPGRDPQVCSFNVLVDCRRARSIKVNPPVASTPGTAPDITIEFDQDPHVTLEIANNVTGPWLTVTNAPPKYVIKAARDRGKFFRLKDTTPQ